MLSLSYEPPAFEHFYTTYQPLVRHIVSQVKGYPADLDDLTQETFVRAWKAYDHLDASQNVAAWIGRIARCVAIDFLRAASRRRQRDCSLALDDGYVLDLPDAHSEVQRACVEESEPIARAYRQLPPDDQQVLRLLAHEYTLSELAAVLHLDRETCRTRIKRARRRFQRRYEQAEGRAQ